MTHARMKCNEKLLLEYRTKRYAILLSGRPEVQILLATWINRKVSIFRFFYLQKHGNVSYSAEIVLNVWKSTKKSGGNAAIYYRLTWYGGSVRIYTAEAAKREKGDYTWKEYWWKYLLLCLRQAAWLWVRLRRRLYIRLSEEIPSGRLRPAS